MTATSVASTVSLGSGVEMPWLGLGVFQSKPGRETEKAVAWAIEAGYRHVDTAAVYENERSVGRGVRSAGVDREEVFVTTKVWNTDQGYDQTLRAFDRSLDELGFDQVDLYLVHWPVPSQGLAAETWRALERIHDEGRARAIGLSNFHAHHIEQLMDTAQVAPTVNQIELHPYLQQDELVAFCAARAIVVEAWSPLAKGEVVDDPVLRRIGEKHGKTPVQVTVRWLLQRGIVAIPKSVHRDRIVANAQVFDFELDGEDLAAIADLDEGRRTGPDPDRF